MSPSTPDGPHSLEEQNAALREQLAELEQRLAEAEQRQRATTFLDEAQRLAKMGCFQWNLESGEIAWSPELYRIVEVDPESGPLSIEEFAGRVHPDDRDRVYRTSEAAARTGQAQTADYRLMFPEGRIKVLRTLSSTRDGLVYGVMIDTTEQSKLQTQLRETQKLQAVGRLAGGIAHAFNNLLTVIQGNLALLDDVKRAELTDIGLAANEAATLTRQLLAYSRRAMTQARVMSLPEACEDALGLVRQTIGEEITVRMTAPDDGWVVRVDPAQITQILVNLAVNARDAMPDGGAISIAIHQVTTHGQHGVPDGDWVRLRVTDDGQGMSAETLAHVFDPFFTTKPAGRGTGLGLAMVYGAMKQMGGHATARSTLGAGTTIELHFPRQPAIEQVAEAPVKRPPTRPLRLLLVEDDPTVLAVVERMLKSAGHYLVTSTQAHDALGIDDPSSFDALVTDVRMPSMSGPSLAAELRKRAPGLRVLFMTGYAPDLEALQTDPGKTSLLNKPFNRVALLEALAELVG